MKTRNEFILDLIEQAKKKHVENSDNNFPTMSEREKKDTLEFLNKLDEETNY